MDEHGGRSGVHDADGNGRAEAIYVYTDAHAHPHTVYYDTNQDGNVDWIGLANKGSHRIEVWVDTSSYSGWMVYGDPNDDGKYEIVLYDSNRDGTSDWVRADINRDGYADATWKRPANTSAATQAAVKKAQDIALIGATSRMLGRLGRIN